MCLKFQLSSSNSFQDMWGPKFTLRGTAPLRRSLAITFSYLNRKRVFCPVYVCVEFQLSISDSSRDIKGIPN